MNPIDEAVRILRAGGLVAFPTETVYGLGADARDEAAVARIFEAKGRPAGRALTVHLGPHDDPDRWGVWTDAAAALAADFWPGPLTLIVPRRPGVPDLVTGGQDTVGLRVPDHPLAMALLDAAGGLAAPSANRTGRLSPTTADHVRQELGDRVDFILDGGTCRVGVESTVLSLVGAPRILRAGAVSREEIAARIGAVADGRSLTPHYRPRTPVRMLSAAALAAASGARIAALSSTAVSGATWIETPRSPKPYARDLYSTLRDIDNQGYDLILVEPVPTSAAWEAVAERLASLAQNPAD